jgi:methyl-accepting chemotaxis protein
MKSTIWKRTLLFVIIPFFVIFAALSLFIMQTVLRESVQRAEQNFRNLGRLNESNLKNTFENMALSVAVAAAELQNIDHTRNDARAQGDNILMSSFTNPIIHNTWLAFEPNAFDGRDQDFPFDYPGAPSGRYIRSFVRDQNTGMFHVAPDMDETVIDDPEKSWYYVYPKEYGEVYFDILNEFNYPIWDYGIDEGPVNTMGVSAPVFRNGKVIGVVGYDIVLNNMILGEDIIPGSVLLVFSPGGQLWFGGGVENVGKTIRELGFKNWEAIMAAFERGELFINSYEETPILGTKSFGYFMPMSIEASSTIVYLYAAIPQDQILSGVYSLIISIAVALFIALLLFSLLLLYIARSISKPIHELTIASEAISEGDLNREIPRITTGDDEINTMSRSLYRMVEQFRVYIALQTRARELLDLHMKIQKAMYDSISISDAFNAILPIVSATFNTASACVVYINGKTPIIIASHTGGDSTGAEAEIRPLNTIFLHHDEAVSLLDGKKYLLLNAFGLEEQKISFAAPRAAYLCLLPFFTGTTLQGYFLMEWLSPAGSSINDDSGISFIADTISYILTQKEKYEAPVRN